MCGFFFSKNIDLDKYQINRIRDLLKHRGPDYSNYLEYECKTYLIHTRLSIQDLSTKGNQPMVDKKNGITIIYNGEIYNHLDLREEYLKKFNLSFNSWSDTETLLNLYLYYKYDFLSKLKGIFSFCIYDSRDQSIFVARDQFGIKPLYYFEKNNQIIFSSEIKPIIFSVKKYLNFNYREISKFLNYLFLPNNELTSFDGIKKIKPGNALIIDKNNNKKFIEYFSLSDLPMQANQEINYHKFDEILNKVILSQTLSDVPLSIFLSGGLDSSTILYYLDKNNFKNLDTFTIKNSNDEINSEGNQIDYPFAEELSYKYKSRLHKVDINMNFEKDINDIMYILEEPISDPAPYSLLKLCKKAKELDIKVTFSGTGGDEVFAGYRRHMAARYSFLLNFLPKSFYNFFLNYISSGFENIHQMRRINKLLRAHLKDNHKSIIDYFHWINKDYTNEILLPQIKENLDEDLLYEDMLPVINSNTNIGKLNTSLMLDLKYFMSEHNLMYNDKIGMSQGLEIRVPFLDIDLVKYMFSYSEKNKIKNFKSKYLLKNLMQNKLPKKMVNRSKTGFNYPLRSIFKYKNFFNETLEPYILNSEIFDYNGVKKLNDSNRLNKVDATYTLYSVMCISSWYNQFKPIIS